MKVNYLLKSVVATVCLFVAASMGAAVEVNDFNSLKSAVESATDYTEITVTGDIAATGAIAISKFVKIEGNGVTITGSGADRIFNVNVPSEKSFVWIKGITFTGGKANGNGGAVAVSSGRVHFTDCIFEANECSDGGGAVYGEGSNSEDNPSIVDLEFYNCEFYDNFATNAGGAIRVANRTSLLLEHCIIQDNSSLNQRGGALALNGPTRGVRIYHTSIASNYTRPNPTGDPQGTGGIQCNGEFPLYIANSSIANNKGAGDHASAINLDGNITATLVNTSIIRNQNGGKETADMAGVSGGGTGSIWTTGGTGLTLTLVNCTYMENRTAPDNNGGNSSGISIQNAGPIIRIYNSVLLGNLAYNEFEDMTPNGSVDIIARNTVTEFTIKNSIIGNIHSGGALSDNFGGLGFEGYVSVQDNPNIPNKSLLQEYEYATNADWIVEDESGVYMEEGGPWFTPSTNWAWYSFQEDAYATNLGDAALLSDEDSEDDMFLATRAVGANGTIWAGSIQGLYEDDEPELPSIADDPIVEEWVPVNIKEVNVVKNEIKMNTVADRGSYINLDFGKFSGHVKAELIGTNGQVVKTLINNMINGTYPCNVSGVASGMYLMKITLNNNEVISKRVIVK
ncbi:MAG: T9SS type A sorting domain-containing protein [Dysgonamonadaceae bacterium]|jgi:hypothetical protein|nr:T9SS type A sorting domain-containing protein [Dysgonamonadaceae bacterium]